MATSKAKTATKKSSVKKSAKTVEAAVKTEKVGTVKTTKNKKTFKNMFSKKYEGKEDFFTLFAQPKFIGALIAEVIGVFLITVVFMSSSVSPLYIMFGIVGVTAVIYALSGAHLNPAITIGQLVTRRISAMRAVFYIIAQLIGGMLAFVMLSWFIGGAPAVDESLAAYGQTAPTLLVMSEIPEASTWFFVAIELIGAAILAFAFARALQYKRSVFTFASIVGIGALVAFIFALTVSNYIAGGYVTGETSIALNPSIAIALEAFTSQAESFNIGTALLVYAAAPIVGGIIGFIISDSLEIVTETEEA